MELPIRLNNSPLIDCIIEIRFMPAIKISSAVFGVIYDKIKDCYKGNVIPLPVANLPENIRETDPNLKFKPLYYIEGEKTNIQIGSDVINISAKMPYSGWSIFSNIVTDVFQKVFESDVVGKVLRLGHRYVNFIPADIASNLKITIKTDNTIGPIRNQNYRVLIPDNSFNNSLMFANDGRYNGQVGSIIDIDTYKEYTDEYFKNNIRQELDNAHQCEKKLFFNLLEENILKTFNPEY